MPISQVPVREPSGLTNQIKGSLLGFHPHLTLVDAFATYQNDFFTYLASDWTVTTSSGSSALQNGNGGQIIQTTAASPNDVQANALTVNGFYFTAGYPAWFGIRFSLADTNLPAMAAGLCAGGTLGSPTNGVYLSKAAGSTTLNLKLTSAAGGGTATVQLATGLANSTMYTAGWFYDGQVGTSGGASVLGFCTANTTQPNAGANQLLAVGGLACARTQTLTNLPGNSIGLTPIFGVQAGAGGAAKTMVTDWIFASVCSSRN
jgi:hypothetical protein